MIWQSLADVPLTWTTVLTVVAAVVILRAVINALIDHVRYRNVKTMSGYYPFIGNVLLGIKWRNQMPTCLVNEMRAQDWPQAMMLKLPGTRYYICMNETDVKHILTNIDNYHAGAGERGELLRELTGRGIFTSDGTHWQIQRKIAAREFNATRFRTFMTRVFCEKSAILTERIGEEMATKGHFDIYDWFMRLTMEAFCFIALGADIGGMARKPTQNFAVHFDGAQAQVVQRSVGLSAVWRILRALNIGSERKMAAHLAAIDKFIFSVLEEAKKKQLQKKKNKAGDDGAAAQQDDEEDDLLTRLMPVALKDDGTYDHKLIRDMVINLVIAGRDTTACGMSWCMYMLALHPNDEAELYDEILNATGGGQPTYDNVADCQFLQAVLSETQRLYPSVPLDPKTVIHADVLPGCGYRVRPGDGVMYANYALGRSPKIWGEDAEDFRPNRWLNKSGMYEKADQFKFPAFQAGRRVCLGIDMAYLEMKIVIATLLLKYKFELLPGHDVEYAATIVLQMKNGCLMTATPRR